ncbi:MAG TPA: NUDIX domain-containing protein [Prolixibacteraceae bacterium]|nr:NUDIX domain-containing protein [Prolixibacteraceae bacterium]HOS00615.1 NUDIX domain-containing protein [Prolixibacteraceae bacterium]HPL45357.1 NUDIX domain-containing protein [Prolixibacteraceae bacterium]HQJ85563.1 NUDIX domain-containing protein [Prolixibacteraceae bacterium]
MKSTEKTHPTRVFSYCPRCGSPDFPAVSERSFKCGGCGFHFFINAAAAVAALIFDEKGRLLVTRRGIEPDKGKTDLPGGFIDPGETAEEALCRELKEELGVDVKEMHYLASAANNYLFSGLSVFTTDLAFRVVPISLEGMSPSDDISSYEWVNPAEVDPEEIPAPSIRHFIKEIAVHERE